MAGCSYVLFPFIKSGGINSALNKDLINEVKCICNYIGPRSGGRGGTLIVSAFVHGTLTCKEPHLLITCRYLEPIYV